MKQGSFIFLGFAVLALMAFSTSASTAGAGEVCDEKTSCVEAPGPEGRSFTERSLCGKFVGLGSSRVCLRVVFENGSVAGIKDFRFRGLPSSCIDRVRPVVGGKVRRPSRSGRSLASRDIALNGSFTQVRGKSTGSVAKGGSRARGSIRVSFRNKRGVPCTSRARKWRAG